MQFIVLFVLDLLNSRKMKFAFVALFVPALIYLAFAAPEAENKYTTKYDNVDIEQILKNDRLLSNYVKCLLDKGNCTPDGTELRKTLPDALMTECTKCSAVQKDRAEKVMRFLAKNKKSVWTELTAKYDPKGEFKENYKKFAEEKGIEI